MCIKMFTVFLLWHLVMLESWRERSDIPSLGHWWLNKRWGAVNVLSTSWWQKRHLLLLMAYSFRALPCLPQTFSSPEWLPSSIQKTETRGQCSVASDLPQLHVARYDWVGPSGGAHKNSAPITPHESKHMFSLHFCILPWCPLSCLTRYGGRLC